MQYVIRSAVTAGTKPLPVTKSGLYLLLTSADVDVQNFCNQICGFHSLTWKTIMRYTLLYAWVGNSAKLCPQTCAFPFSVPEYIPGFKALKPPNSDVGVDGMISFIGHELAELATDPLGNAWYSGQEGKDGATYNMNGIKRRYLVQWVWNHVVSNCTGPNALDQWNHVMGFCYN
ncbi:Protein EXORDIUM-like 3 [Hibiscus syriacus]|uniref:Protein EXORDIUM-like 3 n=1 Tax=Hibiscus syriacus TaxID=106335 RepID=A0A6A2W8Y7_HIBSY|nr:Protein EXORDIUM-like 3 [Hibiscus syriacus]